MSLVCQKWSKEFGSPSVWKNFRFYLTESQLLTDNCPVMKSVRKYSSMLQDVEIYYNAITSNRKLIYTWCRYFIEFLQILTSNSQLISVEFGDLFDCFGVIDTPKYNDMCRAIAEFLGSQRHLKQAEFHNCSFEFNEGVELLRKLTEQSLTHLVLRGFVVWEPLDREEEANFLEHSLKLADFPSLSTFETDYSLIFENLVANLSNDIQAIQGGQTGVLSKLILYYSYYIEMEYFRGLMSTDWWLMKELHPDLQVELINIHGSVMEFFIVPNMPISHLKYRSGRIEIAVLFDHLLTCKTNDHLVTLHLECGEPIQHFSSSFIPFLQACKKLKCLELSVMYPTNGIDLLLKSWLENPHESLEKLIIDVWNIDGEDEYQSLIKLTTGELPSAWSRDGRNSADSVPIFGTQSLSSCKLPKSEPEELPFGWMAMEAKHLSKEKKSLEFE
ncbi:hypothetical protein AVEN_26859-1 [Araneus ventricosus]|uniref:F-box domain-containing protein n=1 Tax=Araneus ventricosus TaxID=182803 RepID=A0A4Y2SGW0_ARAVE|nr:hypothetical protein AVEN_26859-1 [Araneus ventricosus]